MANEGCDAKNNTAQLNQTQKEKAMKTVITTFALLLTTAAVNAQDYSNVTSGMLLGVYCQPCNGGMEVTSIIPGYTAQGRLFPGDILKRATVDGNTLYSLRSHYELEKTKTAIGPNRDAAMEIYRPGEGYIYVWVQFTPLYGPAAVSATGQKQYGAKFKTEKEKPGAKAMFQKKGNNSSQKRPGSGNSGGAASLFGK